VTTKNLDTSKYVCVLKLVTLLKPYLQYYWYIIYTNSVMLNEAKTSRPRPELRGRGRGQFLEVEAKDEAKNNYE